MHEQANAIRDAFLQGQLDGQGQPLPSVQAADEAAYGIPQGQAILPLLSSDSAVETTLSPQEEILR